MSFKALQMVYLLAVLQISDSFLLPSRTQSLSQKLQASCSKEEAEKCVQLATRAISKSRAVSQELGKLQKVVGIVGKGSPAPGVIAVSFTAAFKRQGQSFFTMAGDERKANRGTVIGKVSAKSQNSRLISCDIQKDGGWGKTINVVV